MEAKPARCWEPMRENLTTENGPPIEEPADNVPVRVLTVDDQGAFRRVACEVIASTPGFEPAGEADSGEGAVAAVEKLRPDIVLLDVRMPGIGGIEAAHRINSGHPGTVVVLISVDDLDFTEYARASGAVALVRKQDFCPGLLRGLWMRYGSGPEARAASQ